MPEFTFSLCNKTALFLLFILFSVNVNGQNHHSALEPKLEAYIDGLVQAHMTEHDLPGITVAVVHHDLTLLKGYGYANLEDRIAVDPKKHLFRIASIAKTFIWVAVMQLVERGLVDLDTDINQYLTAFTIPQKYNAPITLRHLMTHTPGFEEQVMNGSVVAQASQVTSLREWLSQALPERIRPPGVIMAYSNYGSNLAAFIVEQVTDLPFAIYIENNIFKPLGMASSTFREALGTHHNENIDARLQANMAKSYQKKDGLYQPTRDYFIYHSGPAGGLRATGQDMASYMRALLADGANRHGRILQESTLRQMRKQMFSHAPNVSGIAHGFFEGDIEGIRTLGHSGSLMDFYSLMELAPEEKLGVFVSINTRETGAPLQIARDIVRYFADNIQRPERISPPANFVNEAQKFEGFYSPTRRNYTTIETLVYLGVGYEITVHKEGYLVRKGHEKNVAFAPVDDLQFRALDNHETMSFMRNAAGEITHLITRSGDAYERIPWYKSALFFYFVTGLALLFSLTTLYAKDAKASGLSQKHPVKRPIQRFFSLVPVFASLSTISFFAAHLFMLAGAETGDMQFLLDWPGDMVVASQWIGLVFVVFVGAMIIGLPFMWLKYAAAKAMSGWYKAHYTVYALVLLATLLVVYSWNMIGFKY